METSDLSKPEILSMLAPTAPAGVAKQPRAKLWTKEEDAKLKRAIARYGTEDWDSVMLEVPGRTRVQCANRWKKTLRHNYIKGPWSAEEDDLLRQVMQDYLREMNCTSSSTVDWHEIAGLVPGRNAKQCKERWTLNLDPSINHGPWTEVEDAELLRLYADLGGKWSVMAKHLPGRSEHAVKSRFLSLQRKAGKVRSWTIDEDRIIARTFLASAKLNGSQAARKLLTGRSQRQMMHRWTTLRERYEKLNEFALAVVTTQTPVLLNEREVKMLIPHPSLSQSQIAPPEVSPPKPSETAIPPKLGMIRRHKSSSSDPFASFRHMSKKTELIFELPALETMNISTDEILSLESMALGLTPS